MPRPKKENMFHKMLRDGIQKGSWDLVCYAFEQETGEKLEPPVSPVVNPPAQTEFQSKIIDPTKPQAPKTRIFGNGTNAFEDNVNGNEVVTKVAGKKLGVVDSAKSDLLIDKKLKSNSEIDYRNAFRQVRTSCDKCGKEIFASQEEVSYNQSPANFDNEEGQKISWLMCESCEKGGKGFAGPRG